MPILKLLTLLAKPIAVPLEFLLSLLDDKQEHGGQEESQTAEERVEALIEAGAEEGITEEDARKLMQQVVAFGDKTVREVMTPRPNIVAVPVVTTLEQLRHLVINEQFSRIPVFEENIDSITGYVHVRDMFEIDAETRQRKTASEIARPIKHVPETKPVDDLMRLMQSENMPMVVVVDEYGNTAGLATMEDLVEVIVGEIRDEHEPKTDVTPDGERAFLVSGSYDVARIPDLLHFRLPEETESTTVGGLVSEWLGRVPEPGESVERSGLRIEVRASNGLRVELVRLSPAEAVQSE
jgi:CBS domain containing-hemolysin-like protein